jgi:hypothetical protein
MKYEYVSHRYAEGVFNLDPRIEQLWYEVIGVIQSITDNDLIEKYNQQVRQGKSISEAINKLIDERLVSLNWKRQSPIFKDIAYVDRGRKSSTWTLDFAKESIAIEVAFNHGGNVSWNLIKPVLSSELNHVEKAIQTKMGIIIAATDEMKVKGGFDSAVGSYEKYVEYLKPLNNLLTTPLIIIGLKAPESFYIETKSNGNKKIGEVVMI